MNTIFGLPRLCALRFGRGVRMIAAPITNPQIARFTLLMLNVPSAPLSLRRTKSWIPTSRFAHVDDATNRDSHFALWVSGYSTPTAFAGAHRACKGQFEVPTLVHAGISAYSPAHEDPELSHVLH